MRGEGKNPFGPSGASIIPSDPEPALINITPSSKDTREFYVEVIYVEFNQDRTLLTVRVREGRP